MFVQRINIMTAVLATIVIAGGTLLMHPTVMVTADAQERKNEGDPNVKIDQPAWGTSTKGLRLGICPAEAKGENKSRVMVVFENVGTEDFVLNLGSSFGFGKKHDLESMRFYLINADGRKRPLVPKGHERDDLKDGALVLHFVTQLVTDGRYAITIDLADLYDPNDVEAELPAGRYRVIVEFLGVAVTKDENDTGAAITELARMHFWTGTVLSEECKVTLHAKPAK
jgi:hypothetical protein